MGSGRAALDIPRYVDLFMQGRLPINKLVSKRYTPGEINDAFDSLEKDERDNKADYCVLSRFLLVILRPFMNPIKYPVD